MNCTTACFRAWVPGWPVQSPVFSVITASTTPSFTRGISRCSSSSLTCTQEWHHVTLEKERVVRAAMAQWRGQAGGAMGGREGRECSLPTQLPGTSSPLLPPYSLHHSPMPLARVKKELVDRSLSDMDCSKRMVKEEVGFSASGGIERKRKSEFERNGSPNIKIRRDLVKEEQRMEEEEEELETEERVMPPLTGLALESARKVVRMLEAFPGGVKKCQFDATYRQVVGEVLDVRRLGFFNTAAYLRSLEGTVIHMNVVDREIMVTKTRVKLRFRVVFETG